MRALLVLIGLIAIAVVVMMSLGMLSFTQSSSGSLPTVALDVQGGQLPKIKAETGSVGIVTTNTTVSVPTLEVKQAPTPAAK